jgi:3-oxoacyl-[acyl-carrier protein] reductase
VTGGSRGIGRAVALGLAAGGAEVHVFDREEGPPAEGLRFHRVDIADAASVSAAVAALPRPALLLVNNAGITRDRSLLKMSDEEWRSVIDVNLGGAFHLLRALAPGMVAAGYGRVVNLASINGMRGKFGQANYAASKGGLIALTKTAARELGPKGVTVNAVAPGMVLTEMAMALPEEFRAKAVEESVMKKLPGVDDVAAAILFLLSDAAAFVTGEVLRVDAGQYI